MVTRMNSPQRTACFAKEIHTLSLFLLSGVKLIATISRECQTRHTHRTKRSNLRFAPALNEPLRNNNSDRKEIFHFGLRHVHLWSSRIFLIRRLMGIVYWLMYFSLTKEICHLGNSPIIAQVKANLLLTCRILSINADKNCAINHNIRTLRILKSYRLFWIVTNLLIVVSSGLA